MAQLYYQNLGIENPEVVMKRVFSGLRSFYEYLNQTENYLKSDDAVLRLSWKPGSPPEKYNAKITGTWIELIEPKDRPNEPEQTFDSFLEENNRELYEAEYLEIENDDLRSKGFKFPEKNKLGILDQDRDTNQILLERTPTLPCLLLRPNTYPLACQIRAIRALQDAPDPNHVPLLRLLERTHTWPHFSVEDSVIKDWTILTEGDRVGIDPQRKFVKVALATPDFAFLEGPPGSGKTTVICELILQLVKSGKRVLLCASTHVAVDNVLERLVDYQDDLIPVRIGDKSNISEIAKQFQFARFINEEKLRLKKFLQQQHPRTDSQNTLLEAIRSRDNNIIEELVLNTANLICGTTIGILQHPEIKRNRFESAGVEPQFDYLILDEASKTTFQEFLVPALLAKRWIIVGDTNQLSPYVEEQALAVNIKACLPDETVRNACIDAFHARQRSIHRHRTTCVITSDEKMIDCYEKQAEKLDVSIVNSDSENISITDIVIAEPSSIENIVNQLPLDLRSIRGNCNKSDVLERRIKAWNDLIGSGQEEIPKWEDEVSWRLQRLYDLRLSDDSETAQKYRNEIEDLLPIDSNYNINERINIVRRVAFPSVLESLQKGFGKDKGQRTGTALSEGLPDVCIRARHVRQEYQQRMHPEISKFSREHIYEGEALIDPPGMAGKRDFLYSRYKYRSVWIDVKGRFEKRFNRNRIEADSVIEEIKHFDRWATTNPPERGKFWEIAILTFYRGQEREIRYQLRKYTRQFKKFRHFHRKHLKIELCTVDRFQGHEADLVLLSFANNRSTSFLESPNRLNVALTRPRFQRVIFGNRSGRKNDRRAGMIHSRGPILKALAETEKWENIFGEDK